jgi:formylglycine-generating enzyme required for sulfatase activity
VEDGFHDNYDNAPTDGSAWLSDEATHVVRGGSWNFDQDFIRVSARSRFDSKIQINSIGFRIAQTIPNTP